MTEEQFKELMESYQKIGNKLIRTINTFPKIDVYDEESLKELDKFAAKFRSFTSDYVKSVLRCREEFNNQ